MNVLREFTHSNSKFRIIAIDDETNRTLHVCRSSSDEVIFSLLISHDNIVDGPLFGMDFDIKSLTDRAEETFKGLVEDGILDLEEGAMNARN